MYTAPKSVYILHTTDLTLKQIDYFSLLPGRPNDIISWDLRDLWHTHYRTILMPEAEEEAEEAGVNNLVFMQCFQDSPEESLWVSGILK